ncbi:hypothetical protein DV737_g2950, partial [Chaetothyriales sp. CBS 132003]
MSPRRSSRARTSHANPRPSSQTASSTSSSTLKHVNNNQRSESVEERLEDSESQATEPIMPPRRSRRNGGDDSSKESSQRKEVDDDEDAVEEEVTRCICGQTDYPGPSDPLRQMVKGQPPEEFGDELGSFFVCCDKCSVWQHGGCVGLTNEDTLPDEYYCEQCKPELHKLIRGANGSKISLYRPVLGPVLGPVLDPDDPSRSSSSSTSEQRKSSKVSKNSEPAKRRATMNSRGAYDEDEMLRRAIEESKHDGTGTLGKRAREEDDSKPVVKRQRTSSTSASSKDRSQSPGAAEPASTKVKANLRGAAARNSREKEIRDKVKADAAAAKAEAANRRNARSERRRGEDSPPPTPSLSPSKAPHNKAKAAARTGSTSPSLSQTKKKTVVSRLTAGRRGRLGRNQYTRDHDADSETPMRDTSHDRNGVDHSPSGGHSDGNHNGAGGKPNGFVVGGGASVRQSKAKTHPARTSMNEMKRRVAAILEFVGQMQTKASTNTSNSGKDTPNSRGKDTPNSHGKDTPNSRSKDTPSSRSKDTPNSHGSGKGPACPATGLVKAVQAGAEAKHASNHDREGSDRQEGALEGLNGRVGLRDDAEFRTMGSVEMMETLTKELVNWQSLYGVWSK